jgi:hypothetical protein
MTKIELEIHEDVFSVINKIKNTNDTGIELHIPEGSLLFENILNLKLLEKEAGHLGKVVHFKTTDEAGLNLIESINDPEKITPEVTGDTFAEEGEKNPASAEATETERTATTSETEQQTENPIQPNEQENKTKKRPLSFAKLNKIKFKPILISLAVVALAGTGVYTFINNTPKAEVKVVIDSQPLTRSLSVKVKKEASTNPDERILRGISVETSSTETVSIETTGEKLVGTKATGKIRIYNKTDTDKVFRKGTEVTYRNLVFILDETVTVPAREDSMEIPPVITIGEATANVVAAEIGAEYNIDKGKSMEIEGERTTSFVASSEEDFKGGESKTVRVVTEEDRALLSAKALEANSAKVQDALTQQTASGQKLISGSSRNTIVKEDFNGEAGKQTDGLELVQTISSTALAYDQNDLEDILDELIKSFTPEGFIASEKDREINVEVLGNSDNSVLNPEEADLQVTIKTFVAPALDEEALKSSLAGKNLAEAEKVLGSIRNIKTYEINLNLNIPIISKIPAKTENINLEVILSD